MKKLFSRFFGCIGLSRIRSIRDGDGTVTGFIARAAIAMLGSAAVSGYVSAVFLPEVGSAYTVRLALLFSALFTLIYLFSAGCAAAAVAFAAVGLMFIVSPVNTACRFEDIILAITDKIEAVATNIRTYMPDYSLGAGYTRFGSLKAMAALAALLSSLVYSLLLRKSGRVIIPAVFTIAVTAATYVSKEREYSVYFYLTVPVLCSLWCVSLQTRSVRGAKPDEEKISGIFRRAVGFMLAAAIVLTPIAANESFSSSVMQLISDITGIRRVKPNVQGGYGEGSEASDTVKEVDLQDLEARSSLTDLKDIDFTDEVIYQVYCSDTETDLFLRRHVYGRYENNRWTISDEELYDDSYAALAQLWERYTADETTDINRLSRLSGTTFVTGLTTVRAMLNPGLPAVPAGSTEQVAAEIVTVSDDSGAAEYNQFTYQGSRVSTATTYDDIYFELIDALTGYYEATADKSFADIPLGSVSDEYLSLPGELSDEFSYLAGNILDEYGGEYKNDTLDAVYAVQKYLTSTKRYTMNPQMSDRYANYDPDKDAIYNFLYNTGEGYCVHFASSAVLLLRSLGINARYVTGYSSRTASSDGTRYVTGFNSHAWAEVWIDNIGWLPFEVTAESSLGFDDNPPVLAVPRPRDDISGESTEDESSEEEPSEAESSDSVPSESEPSDIPSESGDSGFPDGSGTEPAGTTALRRWLVPLSVTAAALIAVLIPTLLYERRCRKKRDSVLTFRRDAAEGRYSDPTEAVLKLHIQFDELMEAVGMRIQTNESPFDFAARADRCLYGITRTGAVMNTFMAAEFGGAVSADRMKECGAYVIKLNDYAYETLSGRRKRRYRRKGILTDPIRNKEE